MEWWAWISVAFLLLIAEMFIPTGFVLMVFGASFFLTGLIVLTGFLQELWLQYLTCAGLIIILLFVLRKPILAFFGLDKPSNFKELDSEEVLIVADINPGDFGQGEMRGTHWKVKNTGSTILRAGDRCKVQKIDGLTLETHR